MKFRCSRSSSVKKRSEEKFFYMLRKAIDNLYETISADFFGNSISDLFFIGHPIVQFLFSETDLIRGFCND